MLNYFTNLQSAPSYHLYPNSGLHSLSPARQLQFPKHTLLHLRSWRSALSKAFRAPNHPEVSNILERMPTGPPSPGPNLLSQVPLLTSHFTCKPRELSNLSCNTKKLLVILHTENVLSHFGAFKNVVLPKTPSPLPDSKLQKVSQGFS